MSYDHHYDFNDSFRFARMISLEDSVHNVDKSKTLEMHSSVKPAMVKKKPTQGIAE